MTHSDISNPNNSGGTTGGICLPFEPMIHIFSSDSVQILILPPPHPQITSRLTLREVNIFIPDEKQDVQSTILSVQHEASMGSSKYPPLCLPPEGQVHSHCHRLHTLGFPVMDMGPLPPLQTSGPQQGHTHSKKATSRVPPLDSVLFPSGRKIFSRSHSRFPDPQVSWAKTNTHIRFRPIII